LDYISVGEYLVAWRQKRRNLVYIKIPKILEEGKQVQCDSKFFDMGHVVKESEGSLVSIREVPAQSKLSIKSIKEDGHMEFHTNLLQFTYRNTSYIYRLDPSKPNPELLGELESTDQLCRAGRVVESGFHLEYLN